MKKSIALVVSLILVLTVTVGGTLAFLIATSGPVENIFNPSKVTTEVVEDITSEPGVKKNVKIQNTGDTEAYIRAAVIVTWQNEAGDVYGTAPILDTDYSITFPTNTGWVKGTDGYYYFASPVKSVKEDANNCYTDILIAEAKPMKNAPETDYFLCIEILGSGIQSVPENAVESAWPTVKVENGKLTAKSVG